MASIPSNACAWGRNERACEFRQVLRAQTFPAPSVIQDNRSLIYYTGNEGKSFGTLRFATVKGSPLSLLENDRVLLTDRIP